jgi:hypothetical protein
VQKSLKDAKDAGASCAKKLAGNYEPSDKKTQCSVEALLEERQAAFRCFAQLPFGRALPHKVKPSSSWHNDIGMKELQEQCAKSGRDCHQNDVYTFGVFTGTSMMGIGMGLTKLGLKPRYWAFDSFKGLPDPEGSAAAQEARFSNWVKGEFNSSSWFGNLGTESLTARIAGSMGALNFDVSRIAFFEGYFNDSLTPSLAAAFGLRPAMYVDVDVDQWIGTYQALDFMFRAKLMVVGTVVGYDDWCESKEYATLGDGMALAHAQITTKYGLEWTFSQKSYKRHNLFVLKKIGSATPKTGLEDSSKQPCMGQKQKLHQQRGW